MLKVVHINKYLLLNRNNSYFATYTLINNFTNRNSYQLSILLLVIVTKQYQQNGTRSCACKSEQLFTPRVSHWLTLLFSLLMLTLLFSFRLLTLLFSLPILIKLFSQLEITIFTSQRLLISIASFYWLTIKKSLLMLTIYQRQLLLYTTVFLTNQFPFANSSIELANVN